MNNTTWTYETNPRRIIKTTRLAALGEILRPLVSPDQITPIVDVSAALQQAHARHQADFDRIGLTAPDDYCGAFDEPIEMELVGQTVLHPGSSEWPATLTPLLDRVYPDRGWVPESETRHGVKNLFQRDPLALTVTGELDEILINNTVDMGSLFAWSIGVNSPEVSHEEVQAAVGTIFVERLERKFLGLSDDESVVFHHTPGLQAALAVVTEADGTVSRYVSTSAGHQLGEVEAPQAREIFLRVVGRRIISMSLEL